MEFKKPLIIGMYLTRYDRSKIDSFGEFIDFEFLIGEELPKQISNKTLVQVLKPTRVEEKLIREDLSARNPTHNQSKHIDMFRNNKFFESGKISYTRYAGEDTYYTKLITPKPSKEFLRHTGFGSKLELMSSNFIDKKIAPLNSYFSSTPLPSTARKAQLGKAGLHLDTPTKSLEWKKRLGKLIRRSRLR